MQITRLNPDFAAAYRSLMLQAYANHPTAFASSVAERAALPLTWWQQRLGNAADAQELVLAALDGDRLLGVAGLSFATREKERHKATLFGMYLQESARGQGLGRALVEAVLAQARARPGVRLVQLTVSEGNQAALALYQQCGFVEYGREPMAVLVAQHYVAKLHMWCDLQTWQEAG